MKEKFIIGKTYKFNPIRFMIDTGIDELYDAYCWIKEIKDLEFKITKESLLRNGDTIYRDASTIYDLNIRWCIEVDSDVHYLGLLEDTYGSSVALYEQDGKLKTKHIKLFEEMIENKLTNK